MSEQSGPTPQRIGDAQRDRAAELLRDHLADGRLDQWEFDERLTRALTARTQADLDPLFTDLPGPRPGGSSVTPSYQAPPWQQPARPVQPVPPAALVPAKRGYPLGISTTMMWVFAIVAAQMIGWENLWWIVFFPIFLSGVWGHQHKGGRNRC